MALSISLWNDYSTLSHTLALALQGGDKELAADTINKLSNIMAKLYENMDAEPNEDEQFEGLKV